MVLNPGMWRVMKSSCIVAVCTGIQNEAIGFID